jgi:protoheme IX farnesyltransferase
MFKTYADLTKLGIVIFVLLSGLAGYAASYASEITFQWPHFISLMAGLYFLSSGSLALNQVQEFKMDAKMPRTSKRPVASGKIKPAAAGIFAVVLLILGAHYLYLAAPLACWLGLVTVALYNGLYVYWWKPKWIFAAIPGALPGALPVTIGYAANSDQILSLDSIYLFLVLFTWQMPHFWALAIRYKGDYEKGGVPTLPTAIGQHTALYHLGLWTFLYLGIAVAAPLFYPASWFYLALVIPLAAKVLQEFILFYRSDGEKKWLSFFMWINVSVLIFQFIPVLDKWNFLLFERH